MTAMKLPEQKSEINTDFKAQKFALIGQPGIGKSEFLAQEPGVLFIETEAGLNYVSVFKMPARTWNDLREIYGLLKAAKDKGELKYTMVAIDTIDRLVDMAEEEVVGRAREFYSKMANEINTIGDIPNGGGWSKTRELVATFFNRLEGLGVAVAYVGHLSTKRVDDGVRKYDKNTISLWKGVGEDMLAWADHLLHIEARHVGDRLQRVVYTKPTQSREAKSRGAHVPDGTKWGDDVKENYAAFKKLFK